MIAQNGCSAFTLKVVAIVGMTMCHVAAVFGPALPFPAVCALTAGGGATFPIMAFLLTEGYRHTSDLRGYAARLAAFAVVSQVPYAMVFEPLSISWGSGAIALPFTGNVLFTLLLGLGLLWAHDNVLPRRRFLAVLLAALAASVVLDWGVVGPVTILAAHVLPEVRPRRVLPACIPVAAVGIPALSAVLATGAAALPEFLYEAVGGVAAVCLLARYDGTRGRPLKWFFYCYYPAHIALLGILASIVLV